jgi:methylmalonyl-CoA mutase
MIEFEEFSKAPYESWKATAEKDLKGKPLEEVLNWSPEPGLTLGAYYDQTSSKDYQYITNFFSQKTYPSWRLYETIAVDTEKVANQKALDALNNGCDGIVFDLGKNEEINLKALLEDILTDICDISFAGYAATSTANQMAKNPPRSGILFTNPEKEKVSGFRSVCVSSQEKTTTGQIADLVRQSIELLTSGFSGEDLCLYVQPGKDFYQELAKIRSLRFLLSAYLENLGRSQEVKDLFIYASPSIGADYKSTMISNASAGLASVVAGVNAISFELGTDKPESFSKRIARNTGNLLREESKLSFEKDPVAGNYFLDYLTHELSSRAWEKIN